MGDAEARDREREEERDPHEIRLRDHDVAGR